jgi:FKBP-type peptidyl-prolyl cis-trans isomerase
LENGTVFDASAKHGEPLKFRIGEGSVIEGWEKGIAEMQLGEKADLVIKSEYAYGKMGSPPTIPADATLIFTVDLIAINDQRPTRWMMSDIELVKASLELKD